MSRIPRFRNASDIFGIERGGSFVFGAGFVGAFQGRVNVGELKVGPGDVGFFSEEFLQTERVQLRIDWCRCRVGLRRGDR